MPLATEMVAMGLTPSQAKAITGTPKNGLVATGSTQADALHLPAVLNTFTTVAPGTGALLPQGAGNGDMVMIFNQGANDLAVYPPGGGTVNGGGTNAPFTQVAGKIGIYWCMAKWIWVCLSSGSDGGAGLTGSGVAGTPALWTGASNLIANDATHTFDAVYIGATPFVFKDLGGGVCQLADPLLDWSAGSLYIGSSAIATDFPSPTTLNILSNATGGLIVEDVASTLNSVCAVNIFSNPANTAYPVQIAQSPSVFDASTTIRHGNSFVNVGLAIGQVSAARFVNTDTTGNKDYIQLNFGSAESVSISAVGTFEFQNSGLGDGSAWFGWNFDPSLGNSDIVVLTSIGQVVPTTDNTQDLGQSAASGTIFSPGSAFAWRTAYFGTSVVNAGYDEFGTSSGDPSAPSAGARLYSKVVGGKNALYVIFPSGAAQQIKVEA